MTMRRGMVVRAARALCWMLAFVLLGACAGPQAAKRVDPEARLVDRAKAYWESRIKGDLLENYRFHEPNFRKLVTFTAFSQGRGVTTILDYEVKGVKIDGTTGVVSTRYYFTLTHPLLVKPVTPRWDEIEEQWRWVDGEWYRRYRFPVGEPYPERAVWDPPPPEAGGQASPPAAARP